MKTVIRFCVYHVSYHTVRVYYPIVRVSYPIVRVSYPFVSLSYPIVRVSYPIVYHVKVNVAGTVEERTLCMEV